MEYVHVPEAALLSDYEAARDSLQKTFAALMLWCSRGDAINMAPLIDTFGIKLTSVTDYARGLQGSAAGV